MKSPSIDAMSVRRPRDPTRRNRNIGTDRSGHGLNNSLVIPERWSSARRFYETLVAPIRVTRGVGAHAVTFLVEKPNPGFGHACSIDDIVRVLTHLEIQGAAPVDIVVLRQPTRKQRILSPVWGRLQYFSAIGYGSKPAISIEAQPISGWFTRELPRTPDDSAEHERLIQDGHGLVREGKLYRAEWSPHATRTTQLYRTLPHEVGHWMDYVTWPQRCPIREEASEEQMGDLYFSRPDRERELFAHQYALKFLDRIRATSEIPFDPLGDRGQIEDEGMSPDWFSTLGSA